MELERLYILWNMVNSAILTIVAIYTWAANRDKASRSAIQKVSDKAGGIDTRVTMLEQAIRHVPNDDDLDVLHKRITEVSERQQSMLGELHAMNKTLGLIQEYLLNHRSPRR